MTATSAICHVRQAVAWRLRRPAPTILLYHRVARPDLDPWGLVVTPDHLTEQLAVLRRVAEPVTLDALVDGKTRTRRTAVAVTFDDGYDDTLHVAAEVLERAAVPSTVFISTAGVDGNPHCWWDRLAELLLRTARLPRRLALTIGGEPGTWDLGVDAEPDATRADPRHRWRAGDPPPTRRHSVYLDVWRLVVTQPDAEQRRIIALLQRWADDEGEPPARLLDGPEIIRLAAHGGVTVGGHTVNHLALPAVDEQTRRWEIERNRAQLTSLTGAPVDHFAYPYGRYGPHATATVRAAGFMSATTTDGGPVPRRHDPHVLPRVPVPDLDGRAFEQWLRGVRRGMPT